MTAGVYDVRAVARVESSLIDAGDAPKQGDEGAPEADLVFDREFAEAIADIRVGEQLIVLTWLHRARRDVVTVHPRADEQRRRCGVFSTRSPNRPNPIGLHLVEVVSLDGLRIRVRNLEAIDGTPVLDVKPVLGSPGDR